MKTFLIFFYFLIWSLALIGTMDSLHLWGEVEGIILFVFYALVFIFIYFVLEDHGVWEYVSVYVSQLLS